MPKLAAIYARVSSSKQKEGDTIDSQVSALLRFAQDNKYAIPDELIFKDAGYSGSLLQRPAMDQLREVVREGEINAVLVYSPDRLSRKFAFQLLFELEFQKFGTELIFFNTPQAKTPEDVLSLQFKGIFAEYERAQIAERCRRGRAFRAKQGSVSVISTAPYGYKYRKKTPPEPAAYVVDEVKSKIVKRIYFQYTSEQKSIRKIALELDVDGIKPPRGGQKWHNSTVRDILKNPAYTGMAYHGKSEPSNGFSDKIIHTKNGKNKCPQRSRKVTDSSTWTMIQVPAIINENEYALAQRQLNKNIETSSRNTQRPSLLQGLLICSSCGHPYYKKTRPSQQDYYACSTRLTGGECSNRSFKQNELDEAIWNHVINLLRNPQLIDEEINNRLQEYSQDKKVQIKRQEIEKEIFRLNKAKDKLLDAYQDGDCLTLDDLKKRVRVIEKQRIANENALKGIQAKSLQEEKCIALKRSMEYFLKSLDESHSLDVKEKQKVIRLLVDEVRLSQESIEITHCIPIPTQPSDFSTNVLLRPDGYVFSP